MASEYKTIQKERSFLMKIEQLKEMVAGKDEMHSNDIYRMSTEMEQLRQTIEGNDRSHNAEIEHLRELLDQKENDLKELMAEKEEIHIAEVIEIETMKKLYLMSKTIRLQTSLNDEDVFLL